MITSTSQGQKDWAGHYTYNRLVIPFLALIDSTVMEEKWQMTLTLVLDSAVCLRPQYGRTHVEKRRLNHQPQLLQ